MTKYFSKQGFSNFSKRINDLEAKLVDLQSQIQYACEVGGDVWHDNFTYETLTEQIRMYDKELKSKHNEISDAVIMNYPNSVDKVCFGAEVNLIIDGLEKTFKIVGYGESNPDTGEISYITPMANAIMHLKPGDKIKKKVGTNLREIEIVNVKPIS